jgi:hypothetical protein
VVSQRPVIVVESWGSLNLPGVEAAVALLLLGRGRRPIFHLPLGRSIALLVGLLRRRVGLLRRRVGLLRRRVALVALMGGSIATVGEEEEAVSQSVPS